MTPSTACSWILRPPFSLPRPGLSPNSCGSPGGSPAPRPWPSPFPFLGRRVGLAGGAHSSPRRGDEKPGRWESQLPTSAIPMSLAACYRNVRQPAKQNMRYSVAVQEFVETSILAFECGHSEEGLRRELPAPGSKESPFSGDEDQAIFYAMVAISWLTLGMAPKATVMRWATAAPVSDESARQWQGFVKMIVDAYFEKRWAWYPIEPLQMEIMANGGSTTHPADVAEMARLVYCTLELAAPQFPR